MEEAGYQWMALRATLNTMNMVAMLLHTSGTDDQKKRFLEPLLAGQRKIWLGVTEPNHGSNVSGVETRAVARDDHYLVNGSKLWITNGIWGDFGILVRRLTVPHAMAKSVSFSSIEKRLPMMRSACRR